MYRDIYNIFNGVVTLIYMLAGLNIHYYIIYRGKYKKIREMHGYEIKRAEQKAIDQSLEEILNMPVFLKLLFIFVEFAIIIRLLEKWLHTAL